MSATITPTRSSEIESAIADGVLRYSTVWEDYRLLHHALPIDDASDVLVIAGAGCNALNLLLRAPRRVVALDFNPAQTALLELKLAAIRTLTHAEFVRLIGIRESVDRLDLYERARSSMSEPAQRWWDENLHIITAGIEASGRLDRFIAQFRERHLSRVHGPAVVDRLLALDEPMGRRYAEEVFLTPALETVFRAYFSREAISEGGRDASQFRHASETDVADWFWRRLRWVTTELSPRGNFYLERFLRGGLRDLDNGPPYLRPRNYGRLRELTSCVDVINEDLERYLSTRRPNALSAVALSDVFEYMPDGEAQRLFARLATVVRPGGRLAFWNLLVPRHPSNRLTRLRTMRELSSMLGRNDRSWFYSAFQVVEVVP